MKEALKTFLKPKHTNFTLTQTVVVFAETYFIPKPPNNTSSRLTSTSLSLNVDPTARLFRRVNEVLRQ